MATSQITRKDILARRRGRRFEHNAAEDLPEDLKAGGPDDAGADPKATGDTGPRLPEGGFTADAAASLADGGDDAAPASAPESAAPARQAKEPEAEPAKPAVNDALLREEMERRLALEARLREREETLNAQAAQLQRFQERESEMEALQRQFKETEEELSQARRREFEANIEHEIDARVEKLMAEDDDGNMSHETARALAKRVLAPTMTAMLARFNDNEKRLNEVFNSKLQETSNAFDSRINELQTQRTTDSLVRMNRQIQAKYPDFTQRVASKDYAEWGAQSPRFSLDSYSTLMSKAYAAHDTDRVLELMVEFDKSREGRQSVLDGMVEAPVGQVSASRPAATRKEVTYTYEDLGDARRKLQNGEWTRKQFQTFKANFEKAEKESRIQG